MADKVVHFELPADDLERAKTFYRTVFGWDIRQDPGEGYALASTVPVDPKTWRPTEAGAINGGMLKRQAPIQQPVVTINVASIDAAAKKLEQAGGKIVREKRAVGKVGFAAYFRDPEGNVLGLFETVT